VVANHLRRVPADEAARARDVVRRHGSGTLDYFALRTDKQWFFAHDGLVAYANYGGVCLVSPDPIAPAEDRERLWSEFRRFADERGWTISVLGASEEWLSVYRATGMRDLYVGDEAVVELAAFSLAGGRHKGLRQAVNRIARHGYTISFHDPARVDGDLEEAIRALMARNRRGDAERGFSMTLGRIFSPDDTGLLLAVASDAAGEPVAFCQFVPATGIRGYSLDLMRRDEGAHPNGLLDFVLVKTIEMLAGQGYERLGLNFATMRAVLAGETGEGIPRRIERWLLRRMSESMQIESLWRFNAKYDPRWLPRYVVLDSAERSVATAMAIARAESFWELPLIGRFLVPAATSREPDDESLLT
jgi:lysyl-tRNA synthetase class 2